MPVEAGEKAEREYVLEAGRLMVISARTAPKSRGEDDILAALIHGEEKEKLAEEMFKLAEERKGTWRRDAISVQNSDAVILLGVRGAKPLGLSCGACGYKNCEEYGKAEKKPGRDFRGPLCLFKILDLGIALGSAAKTASLLNVDNRIMYRVGVAAMRLGLMPEADVIMGIPISARGKNIYFDRKT
ncbi:hypothetical protein DRO53_04465 [Candidatus Bathyarchaeota archaeon]|nr:MAG: hypothetical protein DRO46_05010 [Candidatus Hecatellales archaeon]RLI34067.1 MAG: hypothetical protein DRO53_04465 [Candidatus Bathyarchaeota archaeon]